MFLPYLDNITTLRYTKKIMIHKQWNVETPVRLDDFLRSNLPSIIKSGLTNSKIRRFIIAGCVSVNGRQCRIPSFNLKKGQSISVSIDMEKFLYEKPAHDVDFTLTDKDVLFEDESIIVVNKPAFFPTEETMVKERKCMHQAVIDYLWSKNPSLRNPPYAGIMHRLDHQTSGVLLFTKTRNVNAAVSDMFQNRTVQKQYRAVSTSKIKNNDITLPYNFHVQNYIGRISPKGQECKVGELSEVRGGQFASTDFTIVAEKAGLYYIDCLLHTGRTHQIRVHLSQSGYPIAGDVLYGGNKGFAANDNRIMLHAWKMTFPHPVTGQILTVEAPLPPLFSVK